MAKKKRQTESQSPKNKNDAPEASVAEATETTEIYEEGEVEITQVDLGDTIKMKQVLDEAVAETILEHVKEEYHWDNFKLLLMFIACLFAMVAQFAPLPFPDSRPILGICGSAYFVISGILQLITTFIDKDSILLTQPVEKSSSNKDMEKYGLNVRTILPRFSEWYTVVIEFKKPKGEGDPPSCQECWSVGKYFDKEGYFDEDGLREEVNKLFKRFEAKQYDSSKDKQKIN